MSPFRSHQFTRFLIGGGLNTAVTWVLFLALARFMAPTIAYTLTYLAGIGLSYFVNSRFVFGTALDLRSLWRYPLVYIVQYVYGFMLISILVDHLAISKEIALATITISSIPITFVLTRLLLKGMERK